MQQLVLLSHQQWPDFADKLHKSWVLEHGIPMLAPKIGVANFIVMAVSSQILFSLLIDHYGLFGAPVKPVSVTQLFGAVLLLIGLATTQLAGSKLD